MPEKKNILMLASTFPRWKNDSEMSVVFALAKHIAIEQNTFVAVLVPHARGAKTYEEIDGVTIHRFRYFFEKLEKLNYEGGMLTKLKKNRALALLLPFFLCAQLMAIIKLVKKNDINILHAHWLIPQGLMAVIYKKLFNRKIKLVSTAHGSDVNSLDVFPIRQLKKMVLNNSDAITAVSNDLAQKINRLSPDKNVEIIGNAVDLERFNKNNHTASLKIKLNITSECLLFVGRMVRQKGIYLLLRIVPEILKEFPDLKIIMVGGGGELEKLKKNAEQKNLKNKLLFTGQVSKDKLPAYYAIADAVVIPSLEEGFGLVALEAFAAKKPVIAADTGGLKNIISHERNGFLFQKGDAKALSGSILAFFKKTDHKRITDQAYKDLLTKYNWKKISRMYSRIYEKL